MTAISNMSYLQYVESKAKPFFSNDGQLKTRLGVSSFDTKVCLIAIRILPYTESPCSEITKLPNKQSACSACCVESDLQSKEPNDRATGEHTILSDPNWAYIRTRTDGSKVFVSISSAAKRLFKPKEEIANSCAAGTFLDLFLKESGLNFIANIRNVNKQLHLTSESLDFLLRNKEHLIGLAKASDEGFIYEKFKKFPRPLEVRSDGTILVHFTKTLLKTNPSAIGDLFFGKGSFKKARSALLFNGPEAGSIRLIASFNVTRFKDSKLNIDHEVSIHSRVKNCPGILRFNREYKVLTSKNEVKSFMDLELCELGELYDSVSKNRLTVKDHYSITLDLLDGLVSLHDAGIIHRDIKLENIFLKKRNERIRAKIGDFGLACLATDTVRKRNNLGSTEYVDPLYFKAAIAKDDDTVEALTTYKLDMYSFGVTIYAMRFSEYFKGVIPEKTADIDSDPLIHLIADCLTESQQERIGPKEAHAKYFERIKALHEAL